MGLTVLEIRVGNPPDPEVTKPAAGNGIHEAFYQSIGVAHCVGSPDLAGLLPYSPPQRPATQSAGKVANLRLLRSALASNCRRHPR